MSQAKRLFRMGILGAAMLATDACTHDFQIRRADAVAPAAAPRLAGTMAGSWSAEQCWRRLHQNSVGQAAVELAGQRSRRAATERLLDLYGAALLAERSHTLRVPISSGRSLTLTLRRGGGAAGAEPADFTSLEPTSNFVVDHADRFSRSPGEGVPVAGSLRPVLPVNSPGPVPAKPLMGLVRALTVVAEPSSQTQPAVTLSLYDPYLAPAPLAADYTTPLALEIAHFRPQRRGLRGLTSGNEDFASTGLYPLETPSPDKTPLVFVHGLISDPGDFYRLYNDLAADDTIRRRYQVWVFYYPTSLPVIYAATLLREDVDRFIGQLDPAGTHPALHRAVLVGHSMGGLLCRLAVSDGGDRYYGHYFRQPPDELDLSSRDRALVRRVFYAPGTPNVAQVVFIATPHRGSRLAGGPLGGFGRTLLHMPSTLRRQLHGLLVRNQEALAIKGHLQPGSSLDSLSPKGPVIASVNDASIRPGVRLHSIVGDRGRGGPRAQSSDGVVPYASSHLPQAESEQVVPAGHTGTLKAPETSAELVRVLSR